MNDTKKKKKKEKKKIQYREPWKSWKSHLFWPSLTGIYWSNDFVTYQYYHVQEHLKTVFVK